jgi:hypothetical protein
MGQFKSILNIKHSSVPLNLLINQTASLPAVQKSMPPRKEQPVDGQDGSDQARKRLRSSAVANSTVIKVSTGSLSFALTREDVDRYPTSLLHDALSAVEAADGGAPVEMDLSTILSSSSMSTFSDAPAITVALYRQGRAGHYRYCC